jgi:1-deoxy-D-xylulose-5-phosphate reductoisomerase
MKRKRVVVLGATGSIGESALKVAHDIPDRMEIVGLAAHSNAEKLAAAANKVRPKAVCLTDESKIGVLRKGLNYEPRILSGESGLCEIAALADAEMVLIAIVGTGGLRPALSAIAHMWQSWKDMLSKSVSVYVFCIGPGHIIWRPTGRNLRDKVT